MCRSKHHGGRRCVRDKRGRQLNTLNQRILRAKKQQETLSEEDPKREELQRKIAAAEEEKATLLQGSQNQEDAPDKAQDEEQEDLIDVGEERRAYFRERLNALPTKEEEDQLRKEKPLAPLPASKKKVSIFRSGVVSPPEKRSVEEGVYADSDRYRPEGRTGRSEGVFCSPTLSGVTRWVRGNHLVNSPDYDVREVTVDPDKVFVYSVEQWEVSSLLADDRVLSNKEIHEAYWNSGMTLRQWYDRGIDDGGQLGVAYLHRRRSEYS